MVYVQVCVCMHLYACVCVSVECAYVRICGDASTANRSGVIIQLANCGFEWVQVHVKSHM